MVGEARVWWGMVGYGRIGKIIVVYGRVVWYSGRRVDISLESFEANFDSKKENIQRQRRGAGRG